MLNPNLSRIRKSDFRFVAGLPDTDPTDDQRYQVRALVRDGIQVVAAAVLLKISLRSAFRAYYGEFFFRALQVTEWHTDATSDWILKQRRNRQRHSVPKEIAAALAKGFNFSEQILPLLKEGLSDDEIAARLNTTKEKIRLLTTSKGHGWLGYEYARLIKKKRDVILSLEAWLPEQNILLKFAVLARTLWVFKRNFKNEIKNDTKIYKRLEKRQAKKKNGGAAKIG